MSNILACFALALGILCLPLYGNFTGATLKQLYTGIKNTGYPVTTNNITVEKVSLPFNAYSNSGFAIFDGFYYYAIDDDNEACIYRAPLNNPLASSKICKIEGDGSQLASQINFFKKDGSVFFSYHVGGAVMGSDIYYRVNADGKAEMAASGYLDFQYYDDGMVKLSYAVPPDSGNLYYQKNGEEKPGELGNTSFIYGWVCQPDGGLLSSKSDLPIIDGWVYVSAFDSQKNDDKNKIYRININNKQHELVSDIPASKFLIVKDKIYFIGSENSKLYRQELNSKHASIVVNSPVQEFLVDQQFIYYTPPESRAWFRADQEGNIQSLLSGSRISLVKIVNSYPICLIDDGENNTLIILDKNGVPAIEVPGVAHLSAQGDIVAYKTAQYDVFAVKLPE